MAGVLELTGTSNNTYTGGTFINEGMVLANKQDTASRTFQPTAFGAGNITIGNDAGGNDADVLRLAATAGADQINGLSANVIVSSSGLFDLATNSKSETINSLTLNTGRFFSGDVQTGTGALTVNGEIFVQTFGVTDGTSPAATISGKLNLTGTLTNSNSLGQFNQPQNIYVNDTYIPSANANLTISAVIGQLPVSGGFVTGLREGRVAGYFDTTTQNPVTNSALLPRMGEVASAAGGIPWNPTETYVYTGQFYDADGIVSFGSAIDDGSFLIIDGVPALLYNNNNGTATTGTLNLGLGPNGDGWHDIEIRVSNNAGTGGAAAQIILRLPLPGESIPTARRRMMETATSFRSTMERRICSEARSLRPHRIR